MADLQWDDGPRAERPSALLRILKPKSVAGFYVTALSERWVGLWTHWLVDPGTEVPCRGKDCPADLHAAPLKWVGYFAAAVLEGVKGSWQLGGLGVVELTEAAGKQMQLHFPPGLSIKGKSFFLRRRDKRARSMVLIEPFAGPEKLELPDPPDVKEFVRRLYRVWPGKR